MDWLYDPLTQAIVDREDGGLIADLTEGVSEEDGQIMAASLELYGAAAVALQFLESPDRLIRTGATAIEQLRHAIDRAHGEFDR